MINSSTFAYFKKLFKNKSIFFIRFALDDEDDEEEDDEDGEGEEEELPEEIKNQIKETVDELLEEPEGNSPVKKRKRYPQKLTL